MALHTKTTTISGFIVKEIRIHVHSYKHTWGFSFSADLISYAVSFPYKNNYVNNYNCCNCA